MFNQLLHSVSKTWKIVNGLSEQTYTVSQNHLKDYAHLLEKWRNNQKQKLDSNTDIKLLILHLSDSKLELSKESYILKWNICSKLTVNTDLLSKNTLSEIMSPLMRLLELPTLKKHKLIPMFTMLVHKLLMMIVVMMEKLQNVLSKSILNQDLSVIPTHIIKTLTQNLTN